MYIYRLYIYRCYIYIVHKSCWRSPPPNPGRGASQTARAALSGEKKLMWSQNHQNDQVQHREFVSCLLVYFSVPPFFYSTIFNIPEGEKVFSDQQLLEKNKMIWFDQKKQHWHIGDSCIFKNNQGWRIFAKIDDLMIWFRSIQWILKGLNMSPNDLEGNAISKYLRPITKLEIRFGYLFHDRFHIFMSYILDSWWLLQKCNIKTWETTKHEGFIEIDWILRMNRVWGFLHKSAFPRRRHLQPLWGLNGALGCN